MINRTVFILLVFLVALPRQASAQTPPIEGIPITGHATLTGAPVQTDSCTLTSAANAPVVAGSTILAYAASRSRGIVQYLLAGAAGTAATHSLTTAVTIHFTNEARTTATMVRFAVRSPNGIIVYLRDVGSFSPGVSITHTFTGIVAPQSFFSSQNLACSAHDIIFTNNTVWRQ